MFVAFIESPYQLLQLKEYMVLSGIETGKIFIRKNSELRNNHQLEHLLEILNLDKFEIIFLYNKYIAAFIITIYIVLAKKVLFGDENSGVFRVSKHFVGKKKCIVLDDGTATLNTRNKLCRFTIFEKASGNIIVNDFQYIRSILASQNFETKAVAIIIGAKLAEVGILKAENLKAFLSKQISIARKQVSIDYTILYIPHRHEYMYKKLMADGFFKENNVFVLQLDYPVELVELELRKKVSHIFGALSTALFSMKSIYPDAKIIPTLINESDIETRRDAIINLNNVLRRSFEECIEVGSL